MVLISIVNGVYKPTYNWGAPSCIFPEELVLQVPPWDYQLTNTCLHICRKGKYGRSLHSMIVGYFRWWIRLGKSSRTLGMEIDQNWLNHPKLPYHLDSKFRAPRCIKTIQNGVSKLNLQVPHFVKFLPGLTWDKSSATLCSYVSVLFFVFKLYFFLEVVVPPR